MSGSGVCANQVPSPARIDIVNGRGEQSCAPLIYDSLTAYYIINDNRYKWVETNVSSQSSVSDAVIVRGNTYKFMIARVNKGSWVAIAKSHIETGAFGAWYYDPSIGKEVHIESGYEVLTCTGLDII
jgi:hypothetical protein